MLLKDKQIFIVEDNLQNRIIFQMMLLKHGASVYFERWGEGALDRLQGIQKVDAIILDLMLARGVSGYDIFTKIREQKQFDAIPIVAVSATEPSVGIPKARQMGFSGFIAKPIESTLFPNQIATIIEGNPVWYAGERSLL